MQENLKRLLEYYREDGRTQKLVSSLSTETPMRIQPVGAIGSLPAFILTGAYMNDPRLHLFIGKDKDDAGYFKEDLQTLFGQKNIHWFPDSFRRPQDFTRLESNNILQRTETVNKITSDSRLGEIVVTYPEALFEKVVAPEILGENRIKIKVGEELDVSFLIEILTEFGFNREDFVYEPGQFSVRGSIIDIFSYGNDWPYRVDLFDEEVESIRLFDPTTQLSQKNISEVNIIPNINTRFENSQKISLLKVLPKNTVIWVRDVQMLLDAIENCFGKAIKLSKEIKIEEDDENKMALLKDRAFVRPDDIISDLEKYHTIIFKGLQLDIQPDVTIHYNASPQKSFNKNFQLLIEDLREKEKDKKENFIFVPHKKQAERYFHIFEDLEAKVPFHPITNVIHHGFLDDDLNVALYTDHQIFNRFHRYNLRKGFTKTKAINLRLLRELTPGDYVTHIDHGIGKYSGLEKLNVNGQIQECVRLLYKNNDLLYVSIHSLHKISKYISKEGAKKPLVNKLGSDAWQRIKRKTKRKIKDIAADLIRLYAKRKATKGFPFPQDGYMQTELEASFLYEDTPDQFKATQAVKEDMMKDYPMDRLICGDVGFGKTEIAIRATFKCVIGGKQVAILVPTTILALQHFKTFNDRLKDFGVTVDYINRFRSAKEKRIIFEKLKAGEIDIVIGTHGLLNKQVGFKDLGLLIIDEEQKFGVAAKEKLRNLKVNVDTLTLTATPIPRTLQFSLMAARDLSLIKTPPPNRQPIHTEIRMFNDEIIKESIYYEIYRGGQVFFVHNRVKSLPDIHAMVARLCPDVDIAMAHGQMDPKKLETTLIDFINRKFDVLLCTNIIETGLDIANANTIIINNAHQFGMSDLHQLRGRVGRSNRKAFCYLFSPPLSVLTPDARKRLQTLEEFSDLGSGFDIAMKDLDIRGAGNLLGGEQSGFIADIGFETYQKILDEAIQELKESEFKDLFNEEDGEKEYVRDVIIETDAEMHIPDNYVTNIQERLNLYHLLDKLENEEEIENFISQMADRFGKVPKSVYNLFEALRMRWHCKALGFERLNLKGNKLRCYFVNDPQSSFYETDHFNHLIDYVNNLGDRHMRFKQSVRHFFLVKDECKSLKQAVHTLEGIVKGVKKKKEGN